MFVSRARFAALEYQLDMVRLELRNLRDEANGLRYKHEGWKVGDKVKYLGDPFFSPGTVTLVDDLGFGWRVHAYGDKLRFAYNDQLADIKE